MKCPADDDKTCEYGNPACKYYFKGNCKLKKFFLYEIKEELEAIRETLIMFVERHK